MRVRITEDFTGFPDGTDASATVFTNGETLDVPEDFGRLIVAKGHGVDALLDDPKHRADIKPQSAKQQICDQPPQSQAPTQAPISL